MPWHRELGPAMLPKPRGQPCWHPPGSHPRSGHWFPLEFSSLEFLTVPRYGVRRTWVLGQSVPVHGWKHLRKRKRRQRLDPGLRTRALSGPRARNRIYRPQSRFTEEEAEFRKAVTQSRLPGWEGTEALEPDPPDQLLDASSRPLPCPRISLDDSLSRGWVEGRWPSVDGSGQIHCQGGTQNHHSRQCWAQRRQKRNFPERLLCAKNFHSLVSLSLPGDSRFKE